MQIPATPAQPSGQEAAQQKPQEEAKAEPAVDGFALSAARSKGPAEISRILSASSFLKVSVDGDTVAVLNVESRDIKRSPYLFSITYLRPSSIEVAYSVIPGASARKRKIEVCRHLLNLLTQLDGACEADQKQLYQLLQSVLKDITEFASSDYNGIFAKYDEALRGFSELKRKTELLEAQHSKMSKDLIEARSENDELTLRVKELEAYSDETLMVKLQDWLDVHRNEMSIPEFSKQYNVVESRVEAILNKMVLGGYLELR